MRAGGRRFKAPEAQASLKPGASGGGKGPLRLAKIETKRRTPRAEAVAFIAVQRQFVLGDKQ